MTEPFIVRSARPDDAAGIFELIRALAEYERLSHAVTGSAQQLALHLFGERPVIEALVAESEQRLVGFALFFHNYSTFLTQPGVYLEDIFVQPSHRKHGIGKALLREVARLAVARGCGRFEWSVLDWNANAIRFYQSLGATLLPDWRICRMSAAELEALAGAE